ncbi:MAG: glycosyltransferase [Chloroflexota bacterium]
MNILYLDATRGLFGASRMMLTLVENLDRGKVSPYVILANDINDGDLRLTKALRSARIPTLEYRLAVLRRSKYLNPRGILFMGAALVDSTMLVARLIRKYRITIVQSNTSTVLTGALASKLTGVPHIWHVHEIFRPSDARLFPPLLDNFSTRVVTVSDEAARSLTGYRPSLADKLTVIKNGVDPTPFRNVSPESVERLRSEFGLGPENKVVGMVGRIGMGKGEENFLQMARLVSQQIEGVKFLVAGGTFDNRDYLLDALRARADSLGLAGNVIVTGRRTDMPEIMNLLDLLVQLPDRAESFGLAAAEAMAAGKPAVVWTMGGLSEVVCDFETGYHVSPGDIGGATERVVELLTNDRLRKHMGKAASRRVDREFSVSRYVTQFQELYDVIARQRPPTTNPWPSTPYTVRSTQ